MRKFPCFALACAVTSLFCAACAKAPESASTTVTATSLGVDHRFSIAVGNMPVAMRLAVRPHEQQRGLMHVHSMPDGEGMIFVYKAPQKMSFWMRNTFIPLDIGFFDETGTLKEVHAMFPHVEDPVASYSTGIRYALEMNKGWFARNKIGIGTKLDLGTLAEALAARGFEAETYVTAESP